MKLLVCDYDGTLLINETIAPTTIQALHKWVKQGNMFVIATGRSIHITYNEVKKYNLPVDYIICNNGGVIYDKYGTVIMKKYLDPKQVLTIINDKYIQDSYYFVLSTKEGRFLVEGYQEGKEHLNFYSQIIKQEEIPKLHIYAIDTMFETMKLMKNKRDYLKRIYGTTTAININIKTIDFAPLNVSKDKGIDSLLSSISNKDVKVISVGDGLNDILMIKKNNGYTFPWAPEEVQDIAKDIVTSVDEVINKHLYQEE